MFDETTSGEDHDETNRSTANGPGWSDRNVRELYLQLKSLAEQRLRNEAPGHTLQPTALVHEVFLRLESGGAPTLWQNNAHFFGSAAQAMRRILIDKAREKLCQKRGGDRHRVAMEQLEGVAFVERAEEVLEVNDAIAVLETQFPLHAQIVKLRFFGGHSYQDIADILDISLATVERRWQFARAWLRAEVRGPKDEPREQP